MKYPRNSFLKIIALLLDTPWMFFSTLFILTIVVIHYIESIETQLFLFGLSFLLILIFLPYVTSRISLILVLVTAVSIGYGIYSNRELRSEREKSEFERLFLHSDIQDQGMMSVLIIADPRVDHAVINYPVRLRIESDLVKESLMEKIRRSIDDGENIDFILRTGKFPRHAVGEICQIKFDSARVSRISDSYEEYLAVTGKAGIVEIDSIECKESENITTFLRLRRGVYLFKDGLASDIESGLFEPNASLLNGILFGDDRLFSDNFEESLRISGSTHLIAASGFNVNVVALSINALTKRFLPKIIRVPVVLIGVWIFALFANLSGSIIRAALMFTLVSFLKMVGRPVNIFSVVIATAFIVIVVDPYFVANVGFLLSLGAVVGLVVTLPILESFVEKIILFISHVKIRSNLNRFADILLPSVACITFTIPLSFYFFNSGSYLTLFPNLILIPMVEYVFTFGVVILIFSGVEWLSYFLFSGIDPIMTFFSSVIRESSTLLGWVGNPGIISNLSLLISIMIITITSILTVKRSRINKLVV